jgi:hypothetical protein
MHLLDLSNNAYTEKKMNTDWNLINTNLLENPHHKRHFLRTFFTLSKLSFVSSNGVLNQPVHLILGDYLDKYTKSSEQCLKLFNVLGLCVGSDTLDRFQVKASEEHAQSDPTDHDILADALAIASMDNLNFLQSSAMIRSTGESTALNCTTYMVSQPKPITGKLTPADLVHSESVERPLFPKQIHDDVDLKRPVNRKINKDVCQKKVSNITFDSVNDTCDTRVTNDAFEVNAYEMKQADLFKDDLFYFNLSKLAFEKAGNDFVFPTLKVFFTRRHPPDTEESKFSYVGILDENCDNRETVYMVLKILHSKLKVGTKLKYLMVVGDGKTYDYLIKLKEEHTDELTWMYPFLGDWHLLKNYSIALMKIYGPPGLTTLINLLHHGRTENSVTNCTNFDKTFEFFLQTWEAMFRTQINMFLNYKDLDNDIESTSTDFSTSFLSNVRSNMAVWKNRNDTCDNYTKATLSLIEYCKEIKGEFLEFTDKMKERCNTFQFWHNYIHRDCMTYILFYLAGRSGNWHLRNYCIKQMAPIFHTVNSTFY